MTDYPYSRRLLDNADWAALISPPALPRAALCLRGQAGRRRLAGPGGRVRAPHPARRPARQPRRPPRPGRDRGALSMSRRRRARGPRDSPAAVPAAAHHGRGRWPAAGAGRAGCWRAWRPCCWPPAPRREQLQAELHRRSCWRACWKTTPRAASRPPRLALAAWPTTLPPSGAQRHAAQARRWHRPWSACRCCAPGRGRCPGPGAGQHRARRYGRASTWQRLGAVARANGSHRALCARAAACSPSWWCGHRPDAGRRRLRAAGAPAPSPAGRRPAAGGPVNPDVIANHLQQTLSDQARRRAHRRFGGRLLASTSDVRQAPGRAATVAGLRQYLPSAPSSAAMWAPGTRRPATHVSGLSRVAHAPAGGAGGDAAQAVRWPHGGVTRWWLGAVAACWWPCLSWPC
jgi:hypothetical protein